MHIDSAVDLQTLIAAQSFFNLLGLWQNFGHKFLPAETRHDAHHHHNIDQLNRRQNFFDRRRGVQCDTDMTTEFPNLPRRLGRIVNSISGRE